MDWKMFGNVRQIGGAVDPVAEVGADAEAQFNRQGELLVAGGSSPYENIVAAGRAFEVNTGNTTSLDLAAVIAVPTTAVMLAIYNGEADGGLSYVIDQAWALHTTAAASLAHACLIGVLGTVREAIVTDATPAGALPAPNGMGGRNTKARVVVATTIPAGSGVAANWFAMTPSVGSGVTSLPGLSLIADVNGRIIVPPGRYFGVHVLASAVGHEFNAGIRWHERQLPLG